MKQKQAHERVGISKLSLRLPDEVKAVVRREAAAEGRSMNSWIVRALERRVDRDLAELERHRR
jgi:predicted HicB family RNase H-like nuclease